VIYFIQCGPGGPIKIGNSVAPRERLKALQHACPYELTLLACCDGFASRELWAQERFAPHHIRGEWYHPAPEIMRLIAEIGPPPASPVDSVAVWAETSRNPQKDIRRTK
jgi:hypothetical protein